MNLRSSIIVILIALSQLPVSRIRAEDLEPADVLIRVEHVLEQLERIRIEMGKPKAGGEFLVVKEAEPREVYFQARSLCQKADRLSFELLRETEPLPDVPEGSIEPSHVAQVIDGVLKRINKVELSSPQSGESDEEEPAERKPATTPTDVFLAIVRANRQINVLLDRKVAPSDVYQEVTLAMGYASNLLAVVPDAERNPDPPEFEPGKRPVDVFNRLVRCYEVLRKVGVRSGLTLLELSVPDQLGEKGSETVVPSDVFDIASLLVSELTYLHDQLAEKTMPKKPLYPGRKYPSHVYQRVGILEKQLDQLEVYAEANPDWLNQPLP